MLIFQNVPEEVDSLLKNNTVVAVTLAAFGGALVRWLDRSLQQNTVVHDDNEKLRAEFRELNELLQIQIDKMKARIDELEKEVVFWKDKYYSTIEAHLQQKSGSED